MLPFGVTIPATVPQRSEIAEGLMNYTVYVFVCVYVHVRAWRARVCVCVRGACVRVRACVCSA